MGKICQDAVEIELSLWKRKWLERDSKLKPKIIGSSLK